MIGESDLKVVIGLFQEVMRMKEVEEVVEVELEVVEGGIGKSGR